jgi:hypothetical protein
MLAHRAMAQGEMVAEIVAGNRRSWDRRCIPAVCFTDPEIVTAGLGPEEARRAGQEIRLGGFPFTANGRAMTLAAKDGFVRVVARADNNLVLGIQAVGTGVSELSAAFALALEMGARLEDIAGTIHAHPIESEAFQEAALKVPRPRPCTSHTTPAGSCLTRIEQTRWVLHTCSKGPDGPAPRECRISGSARPAPSEPYVQVPRIRLKHRPAHARSTVGNGTSGGRERGWHLPWRGAPDVDVAALLEVQVEDRFTGAAPERLPLQQWRPP